VAEAAGITQIIDISQLHRVMAAWSRRLQADLRCPLHRQRIAQVGMSQPGPRARQTEAHEIGLARMGQGEAAMVSSRLRVAGAVVRRCRPASFLPGDPS
jgi:hypothetical protein